MLLNLKENKLRLVNCDYYRRAGGGYYYSSSPSVNSDLKSMIQIYECNSNNLNYIGDDLSYRSSLRYGTPYGVYLGDNDSFQTALSAKIVSNITGVKKVFFDPECPYPRFKLNELTSIKRCLSPSKADLCVLSKTNIQTYRPQHSSGGDPKDNIVKILYSKSENAYYLIDHCPNTCHNTGNTKDLQKYITRACTPGTVGIDKFLSAVMNEHIIPSDCTLFYQGKISFLGDQKSFEQIDNILNNYMKIIYDTDLDTFINSNLQSITDEELKSLSSMLQSSDQTTVGMGIKLISSYNIVDAACSIGILISSSWNNISSNSAVKSVGFQQVLKTLGISEGSLHSGRTLEIVNNLYKTSTNAEDKEKAKGIILEKIKKELNQKWNYFKSNLDAIPMDFDFTLK